MWKTITAITLILITISSAVIFMQWNDFTTHVDASGNVAVKVKQDIKVKSKEDGLFVEQTITGLSKETVYQYQIPSLANNLVCLSEGMECEEVRATSVKTSSDTLVFQYELLFEQDVEWLIENWVIQLSDTFMTESTVQIVDQFKREGTFIVGSLLQGAVSREFIEFYVFHGFSDVGALYWHPEFLKHKRLTSFNDVYYMENNPIENMDIALLADYKEATYVSIVAVDKENLDHKGILFVDSTLTEEKFKRAIVLSYYHTNYGATNNWLSDLIINQTLQYPFETTKAAAIHEMLLNYLGDNSYHTFINALDNGEIKWDAQTIDSYITSLSKYRTYLIEDNMATEAIVPIELFDKKIVTINDQPYNDIRVKILDNEEHFPLIELLTSFGYTVNYDSQDKTINMKREGEDFKYYIETDLFIYNGKRYALKEPAITFIDGKSYLTKEWLKSLFSINVNELEGKFVLSKN